MDELNLISEQSEWRIIKQSEYLPLIVNFKSKKSLSHEVELQTDALASLASFAIDDTICETVGRNESHPTIRYWQYDKTVVLGFQDTKLPNLEEGITYLKDQGYNVIVRNSGGLAVVLDEGILNLSIILSESSHKIEITSGYELMFSIIKSMFADFNLEIKTGEISGSYCPGSYDVSINGKKFAGISQRRLKNGVAVQIYIAVRKSRESIARAKLIRNFYKISEATEHPKLTYPQVTPKVMASLNELLPTNLTIVDVITRFVNVINNNSQKITFNNLTINETDIFNNYLQRLVDRNIKVFSEHSN